MLRGRGDHKKDLQALGSEGKGGQTASQKMKR